jgi:predicted nucleic acid-binding protein
MTHPSYPNSVPVRPLIERLRDATRSSYHEFWPDDVSLLDPRTADAGRILGPRQITDLYLLALAVRRVGLFVTFDAAVAPGAIAGAERRHIVSL